ncbi:MAG TPA: uroporphyrinogen decarboxylase family protein [Vicinamibacteria bacterium]|nr:uroporphyrinogen decarboxylase family protein [Vicinamibacteria bacterium]
MNGYQRVTAALRGERPDRVPVMLHNFMMAAREAGHTMRAFREDPAKLAQSFIRAVETYAYDGVMVDVDTATLAGAIGVPLELPADEPALCRGARLSTLEEVDDLEPPDIARDPRVQVWLEAVVLLVRHLAREVHVRGNCDQAPFSLASMMRGAADWMMDLTDERNRERAERLLDHCAEADLQFIRLMAATGAHMVSNGDSPAGPDLVSPRLYRSFALPWGKRLVDEAHRLGLPYALHICGRTDRILGDMLETGADALELDYKTDVRLAHDRMKDRAAFIGNLDPSGVLALGTPALVEEKTRELLAVFADTPRFILNAGCAIPATTPPENLRAMIRAARA